MKICEETVRKALDEAIGSETLSQWDRQRIVRTAEMMDMHCIVFVRSKQPTEDMIKLAEESGIVILSTEKRLYEACGLLYLSGLTGSKVS